MGFGLVWFDLIWFEGRRGGGDEKYREFGDMYVCMYVVEWEL